MNPNIFECDTDSLDKDSKSSLALNVYDSETFEDVSQEFEATVIMPEGSQCPDGCSEGENSSC